jgi:lipopolysaccharide/colanic/teichoic acid biosynthesis glycosyltransferase
MYKKNLKRTIDVFVAASLLILSSPLAFICYMAVKLTSRGPVLFRQERLGENQKPFTLMKFRTMVADAEKECGPTWSSSCDPRVTKVGRVLRKTRLDEIPQLINVLKGDMSFVGPRPIRKYFADILAEKIPYYRMRFLTKPGITGWAQVKLDYAGSEEGQTEKLEYDLFYIQNQSLLFDLYIFLKTIQTIIFRPGQ